eukprot:g10620.t1
MERLLQHSRSNSSLQTSPRCVYSEHDVSLPELLPFLCSEKRVVDVAANLVYRILDIFDGGSGYDRAGVMFRVGGFNYLHKPDVGRLEKFNSDMYQVCAGMFEAHAVSAHAECLFALLNPAILEKAAPRLRKVRRDRVKEMFLYAVSRWFWLNERSCGEGQRRAVARHDEGGARAAQSSVLNWDLVWQVAGTQGFLELADRFGVSFKSPCSRALPINGSGSTAPSALSAATVDVVIHELLHRRPTSLFHAVGFAFSVCELDGLASLGESLCPGSQYSLAALLDKILLSGSERVLKKFFAGLVAGDCSPFPGPGATAATASGRERLWAETLQVCGIEAMDCGDGGAGASTRPVGSTTAWSTRCPVTGLMSGEAAWAAAVVRKMVQEQQRGASSDEIALLGDVRTGPQKFELGEWPSIVAGEPAPAGFESGLRVEAFDAVAADTGGDTAEDPFFHHDPRAYHSADEGEAALFAAECESPSGNELELIKGGLYLNKNSQNSSVRLRLLDGAEGGSGIEYGPRNVVRAVRTLSGAGEDGDLPSASGAWENAVELRLEDVVQGSSCPDEQPARSSTAGDHVGHSCEAYLSGGGEPLGDEGRAPFFDAPAARQVEHRHLSDDRIFFVESARQLSAVRAMLKKDLELEKTELEMRRSGADSGYSGFNSTLSRADPTAKLPALAFGFHASFESPMSVLVLATKRRAFLIDVLKSSSTAGSTSMYSDLVGHIFEKELLANESVLKLCFDFGSFLLRWNHRSDSLKKFSKIVDLKGQRTQKVWVSDDECVTSSELAAGEMEAKERGLKAALEEDVEPADESCAAYVRKEFKTANTITSVKSTSNEQETSSSTSTSGREAKEQPPRSDFQHTTLDATGTAKSQSGFQQSLLINSPPSVEALARRFGIDVELEADYADTNWNYRPLHREQVRFAAQNVHRLIHLERALRNHKNCFPTKTASLNQFKRGRRKNNMNA